MAVKYIEATQSYTASEGRGRPFIEISEVEAKTRIAQGEPFWTAKEDYAPKPPPNQRPPWLVELQNKQAAAGRPVENLLAPAEEDRDADLANLPEDDRLALIEKRDAEEALEQERRIKENQELDLLADVDPSEDAAFVEEQGNIRPASRGIEDTTPIYGKDEQGNDVLLTGKARQRQKEQQDAEDKANALKTNVRFSKDQLNDPAVRREVDPGDTFLGNINQVANDAEKALSTISLTKISPAIAHYGGIVPEHGATAMEDIMEKLGTKDADRTLRVVISALHDIATGGYDLTARQKAIQKGEVSEAAVSPALNPLAEDRGDYVNTSQEEILGELVNLTETGQLSLDAAYALAGSRLLREVNPGAPKNNVSATQLGSYVVGAAMQLGLINVLPNARYRDKTYGQGIQITDDGRKFVKAMKDLIDYYGEAELVNAPATPGNLRQAKTGQARVNASPHLQKTLTDEGESPIAQRALDYIHIRNNMASSTNSSMLLFAEEAVALVVDAIQVVHSPGGELQTGSLLDGADANENFLDQPDQANALKMVGLSKQDILSKDPQKRNSVLSNVSTAIKLHRKAFDEGRTMYHRLRMDPTSYRTYPSSRDIDLSIPINRALVMANPALVLGLTPSEAMKAGITQAHIDSFIKDYREGKGNFTGNNAEIAFRASLGRNLLTDAETVFDGIERGVENLQVGDLLSRVTEDKIDTWAENGRILTKWTQDKYSLTPEESQKVKDILSANDLKRKNWGSKLQSYIDAHNYRTAQRDGGQFKPMMTVEIDMKSAGRTALAYDVGDAETIKRTGSYFDQFIDENGNPREYYYNKLLKNVASVIGGPEDGKVNAIKKAMTLFRDVPGGRDFMKDFSKLVLMTYDYGLSARAQGDNIGDFLLDEGSKKFQFTTKSGEIIEKSFVDYLLNNPDADYDSDTEIALEELKTDLLKVHTKTLNDISSSFQSRAAKDVNTALAILGQSLVYKGFPGLGDHNVRNSAIGNERITDENNVPFPDLELVVDGKTLFVPQEQRRADPSKRGRTKVVNRSKRQRQRALEQEEDAREYYTPFFGSAAVNSVGPQLGHYRESAMVIGAINDVNKGRGSPVTPLLWVETVHDAIFSDYNSIHRYRSNLNRKQLPAVMGWDVVAEINDAYYEVSQRELKKLSGNHDELFDIGSASVRGVMLGSLFHAHAMLNDPNLKDSTQQFRKDAAKTYLARAAQILKGHKDTSIPWSVEDDGLLPPTFEVTGDQLFNLWIAWNNFSQFDVDPNEAAKKRGFKPGSLQNWVKSSKDNRPNEVKKLNEHNAKPGEGAGFV